MSKKRLVIIILLASGFLLTLVVSVRLRKRESLSYQFLNGHAPVCRRTGPSNLGFHTGAIYSFRSDYGAACSEATHELLSRGYIRKPPRLLHESQRRFVKDMRLAGRRRGFIEVTISNNMFDANVPSHRPDFPFIERPGWVSVTVFRYDYERSFAHSWKNCVSRIMMAQ